MRVFCGNCIYYGFIEEGYFRAAICKRMSYPMNANNDCKNYRRKFFSPAKKSIKEEVIESRFDILDIRK